MPVIAKLRDRFEATILKRLGAERAQVNAEAAHRLPNTSSMSFCKVEANTLLAEIGDRVAASAGAACHADAVDVSPVLAAMGVPDDWAMGTVRFSLGTGTTSAEVDEAADVICRAVERLLGKAREAHPVLTAGSEVRLTRFTHGMGCACKIRPQALERILAELPVRPDENVLVDVTTSDDAGVYRLSDDIALVQTTDFFTPIVDDPYDFGAVAAANALSDIYAMGATPLYALNIVGFPSRRLPLEVLREILCGAADKCAEAGISIIGGHTIEDTEPKFGLTVTGIAHPAKILRNSGAEAGDLLVLTKQLGTGIVATGVKRGLSDDGDAALLTALMASLNLAAAQAMGGLAVHACTDVTGFGLLGHLYEMTAGSKVEAEISAGRVPILAAARRLAAADVIPGGTADNLAYVAPYVQFDARIPQSMKWILADAQTSGGLLISISSADAPTLLNRLQRAGVDYASQIGRVTGDGAGAIRVAI
jgi:selenium donor protein